MKGFVRLAFVARSMRARLGFANLMSLIAIVLALTGGAVYAATKIGPKNIKPNAVKSKHIGRDQVKGLDVLESSLGPVPRALDATSAERADNATRADTAASADTAQSAQTAQNAQSAQNAQTAQSAVSAQTANSVGGVAIEPVRVALPEPTIGEVDVLSVAGATIGVGCSSQTQVAMSRSTSAPPLFFAIHREGLAQQMGVLTGAGGGTTFGAASGTYRFAIREASGRVSELELTAFLFTNGFGGPEDCFYQGTIQRYG